MTIGKKADMPDAMEAVRHSVEQKPPHELIGSQRHDLGLAVVAVVLPGEADVAIGDPGQPAVGDGHAVRVAAEISEHLIGTGERALGMDHPLDAPQTTQALGEGRRFGQRRQRAGEAQLATFEGCPQPFKEQSAEPPGEDSHRQEEPRSASDPPRLIRRQATAGDNAVQMGMVLQRLAPGVQYCDCANLCAEMPRVGGNIP